MHQEAFSISFHPEQFWNNALGITDEDSFNSLCLELYQYQSEKVPVYREYIRLIDKKFQPSHYTEIPFLPIRLFKEHRVTDSDGEPELIFSSSGTTGLNTSRHYVLDKKIYDSSLQETFNFFYGAPRDYYFLALLPSYLERKESSLVYMMQQLMEAGNQVESGFFMYDHESLLSQIHHLIRIKQRIFLIGVTYALIDFFNECAVKLPAGSIIMETGGMKGKRKELVREEVHQILKHQSGLQEIHSEYGMTELLSQAYSRENGIFQTPPWMKVLCGDLHDPFALTPKGETGILKVIDLANIHSCAFIETQDIGRISDKGFEVSGRMDHSEWRGCNMMY